MMDIEFESISLPGTKGRNDDYLVIEKMGDSYLCIVADGCGGHRGANFASRFLCEALVEHMPKIAPHIEANPEKAMKELFKLSKTTQCENLKKKNFRDACTTCELAWLNDNVSIFAHVGDSRIYRFNESQVVWRTKDQSFVQDLVDQGVLSEEEASIHPMGNILSNTIGMMGGGIPTVSVQPPLKANEGLALCTDGFWHITQPTLLFKLLKTKNIKKLLTSEVNSLLKTQTEYDDVTLLFIRSHY